MWRTDMRYAAGFVVGSEVCVYLGHGFWVVVI
jgi:hypothetical protein